MFSSRTPRLFAAALMDLAEAMLRPVDVDEASAHPSGDPALHDTTAHRSSWWAGDEPFAEHPNRRQRSENRLQDHAKHRRRLRDPRARRPGAVAPQPTACASPVSDLRSTSSESPAAIADTLQVAPPLRG